MAVLFSQVTGSVKYTGLKQAPTDICKDRVIGTWEATNTEDIAIL